ncbi:MAG: prepilin-type N-terminal cleavage/methylation domain-containing protein [Patescibacteria group bacterium]|nr:prepilin-type N-terminal cleavage/methylation domain-containing protein [Patescibacteria group bacterium]
MGKKIIDKNQKGFTLLEILVSLSLFTLAIVLVGSMYSLSQRSYNKGAGKGELVQNARVSLDRISRELRQSINIVTDLPETDSDPGDPPATEIFFQDGHDASQTTYLRYYLDGTDLRRSLIVYYFDAEPDTYVVYDSVDQYGNPPQESIVEDRVVGEYFSQLQFWGSGGLVHISLALEKDQDSLGVSSSIFKRN